jgi:hypothetical protein
MRPTLILAALAALCAPPAADAAFYRTTDIAFACERQSDMQAIYDLTGQREAQIAKMRSLHEVGMCVRLFADIPVIVEAIDGPLIRLTVTSDPRPLWALRNAIDWSAR